MSSQFWFTFYSFGQICQNITSALFPLHLFLQLQLTHYTFIIPLFFWIGWELLFSGSLWLSVVVALKRLSSLSSSCYRGCLCSNRWHHSTSLHSSSLLCSAELYCAEMLFMSHEPGWEVDCINKLKQSLFQIFNHKKFSRFKRWKCSDF